MFINPNLERIFRGDSKTLTYTIYSEDNFCKNLYELVEGDELYFALLEPNQCWEEAILKKELTVTPGSSNIEVQFKPNDTMCLMPGLYYYQIKLRLSNGEVHTLNPRTSLWIQE